MKISLFQGIVMGVFAVAAVIGLIVFATYKGSSGSTGTGPVLIWGTLPKANFEATIAALTPTDPDLKNVTYVQKNASTLSTDLATAIATQSSPDLVLASQEELKSLVKIISLIPTATLSPATYQSTFIEESNIFSAGGSGYYGVPFLVDPIVLYANRTILSTNGVAKPPATWEALTGLVPSIAVLTPTKQITRGLIALGTYDNVESARGILSTLFLQTGVPMSKLSPTGVIVSDLGVTDGTSVSAGKAVVAFYAQFTDPSKISYTWNSSLKNSEQAFLSGDLALYLGYASRVPALRAANPNLDFIVAPVPQPATATAKKVYGRLYAFMISNGAKNSSGAFAIAALFSKDNEQTVAAANMSMAPAVQTLLDTTPPDPAAAVAYKEGLYSTGWLSPSADRTDQVFSGMIGNVISGRSSIDSALASAEQTLSGYLQQ